MPKESPKSGSMIRRKEGKFSKMEGRKFKAEIDLSKDLVTVCMKEKTILKI